MNRKNNKDSRDGVSTLVRQLVAFISESDIVAVGIIALGFMLYVRFAHDAVMAFTLGLLF